METENFPRKVRQSGTEWNVKDNNTQETLRVAMQKEFDSQLQYAKKLYEDRIESITSFSRQFYENSQQDEVLTVMKESDISDQFVNQRMRELYEDTMLQERDHTIETIHNQLIQLKGEFLQSDQERIKLKTEEAKIKQEVSDSRSKMAAMRVEFEEALKRKDREWQQKSEDVNSSRILSKKVEDQLYDSEARIHRLTLNLEELNGYYEKEKQKSVYLETENGKLQKEVFEMRDHNFSRNRWETDSKIQKISDEYEKLRTYCQQLENEREQFFSDNKNLEIVIQAEQKASHEVLEQIQKKYKTRSKHFKKKIIDQKSTIENLEQQLQSYKKAQDDNRKDLEKKKIDTRDDLKRVKEEWERRCHEILLEGQRKEAELQSRHQLQLNAIQTQCQQIMEQRISELQHDLQTNRSRTVEHDARQILEEKMAELEADFVPKRKFEDLLKDREKLIKEIQGLKNLENSMAILNDECQKAQGEIEKMFSVKMILEEQLRREKETSEEYLEQIEKVKCYYEDEERSKRGLLAKLDSAFEKIGKLEGMHEEEKRKRVQLENEEEALQRMLDDYKKRLLEQEEQLATSQQRYENRMKQNITILEEDLEKEKSKNKQMTRELQGVKDDFEYTQQEKSEIQQSFTTIKLQLEETKKNRTEDMSKYEEEATRHMETRSKLLQSEGRNKHLLAEIESYEKRISDLKEVIRNNDAELIKTKNKLYEYDNELSIGNNEKRILQKQIEEAIIGNTETKERVKSMMRSKLKMLRSDFKALKTLATNETQMLRKDCNSQIQDLLFRFLENTNFMRKKMDTKLQEVSEQINQDWSQKMQDMEDSISKQSNMSINQYHEKCTIQEKQIEALRHAGNLLKKDQKNLIEELEKLKKRNTEQHDANQKLLQENSQLETLLKKNSESFDRLQVEVKQETTKLKQAGELAIDKARKELSLKHENELKQTLMSAEETRREKNELEKYLSEQIKHTENSRESEISQLKKRYQELLDQAYTDIESERDNNLKLKQKFRQLEDETHYLKKEHVNALQEFDIKINTLERQIKSDMDKTASRTIEKSSDIERLNQKLRDLSREIEERDEERQDHYKEKEKIRTKLQELESKMEIQAKNFQLQLGIKEKEIDGLRNTLSKSYSDSMDQVKRAQQLDKETQELTRQVKRSVPTRSGGFAQSPADSARVTPDNLR